MGTNADPGSDREPEDVPEVYTPLPPIPYNPLEPVYTLTEKDKKDADVAINKLLQGNQK